MKHLFHIFFLLLTIAGFITCGNVIGEIEEENDLGGSEAGNPPATRNIRGIVPSSGSSVDGATLTTKVASINCLADALIISDTSATPIEISVEILNDCSFDVIVDGGKAYTLELKLGGESIAQFYFNNGYAANLSFMLVIGNEQAIDMGQVIVEEDFAFPQNEPSQQNDFDLDSIFDFDDEDDDNDGILDLDEADCDIDGIPDDYDLDLLGCNDDDGDGVQNSNDNCPTNVNPDQADEDGDTVGDTCENDSDGDGVIDDNDNCPSVSNSDQGDEDSDGQGNACDDDDSDSILNVNDNCSTTANADQADTDGDGVGNVCEPDTDGDSIIDDDDNCPDDANADQANSDEDSCGNVCDDYPEDSAYCDYMGD